LQDFLPVDAQLNATSVRRDTLRVAGRLEAELGPEPIFPLAGCPGEGVDLPAPPEPITVGIDGGYLRHWQHKQTHSVAIVGESVRRTAGGVCPHCLWPACSEHGLAMAWTDRADVLF
jgi:hypothetical protein